MLIVDVRNNRDRWLKKQEAAIALVCLGYKIVALP
jgi:hypothetical protein